MTLITTPFGFSSTAAQVVEGVDLTGKRAVVTGGASGIGAETVRALASSGAEVTLAVRNTEAGRTAARELSSTTGSGAIRVEWLDLADPSSVLGFTEAWQGPLDILINNAGVMACPLWRTPQGYEQQFATNHLGHFALAAGLHPALAAAGGSRIVAVSSSANLLSPVVFDDLHFNYRPYDPWQAYAQSKTANVLFAVEATRRWAGEGITANALNPGAIATNLQRHVGNRLTTPPESHKTVQQGAATSVLLAAGPQFEGVGGGYFDDCNEAPVVDRRTDDYRGVAAYALAPENAERLWAVSLALTGRS